MHYLGPGISDISFYKFCNKKFAPLQPTDLLENFILVKRQII